MNNFLKKWLIPYGYIELANRQAIRLTTQDKKKLEQNRTFEKKYADVSRCFILATGPSIKNEDLSILKGEFCISVSNFFVHTLYQEIKPEFQIFAPSHPPITDQQMSDWFRDALEKSDFPVNILASLSNQNIVSEYFEAEKERFLYYVSGGRFPVDFTKKIPSFQTVVHIAIYWAIYLGIKEIYLLGVDHNWILNNKESSHFYQEKENKLVQGNYDEWSLSSDLGKEFESHVKLWNIYRAIRTENPDVRIYNLTQNSLLDIFPFKKLKDVIAR